MQVWEGVTWNLTAVLCTWQYQLRRLTVGAVLITRVGRVCIGVDTVRWLSLRGMSAKLHGPGPAHASE